MPASTRIRALLLQGFFFALSAAAVPAFAASAVCRAENGGERIALDVPASPDPFVFHTAEFDQRFRVSAQYLQPVNKLKTYVYDFRGDTAALIHAAEYRLDDAGCSAHVAGFGLNKIYSRNYEREMFLQCFAVCD